MKKTIKIAVVFAAVAALGWAQDKPKGPEAKDPQEANMVNTAANDANPAQRLTELDAWKAKYPDTALEQQRNLLYLITLTQLKKGREAIDYAKGVLAKNPDDYLALLTIMTFGPSMNNNNPSQEDFDTTMAAAHHMIDDADKVFAASNRPPTVPAAEWPKVGPAWTQQLPKTEAQMWINKKDYPRAEQEIGKLLQKDPNDAVLDQDMGQVILAEKIPEKQGLALFYYARAACYDGTGSLPAASRNSLKSGFLTRAYTTFHGSADGLDQLCQVAKANPAPPSDFKVKSTVDIAQDKQQAQEAADKADPAGAIWKTVKAGLTGDNPDQFFEGSVKGSGLPGNDPSDNTKALKWKGKIVSMTPKISPKTIVMAVENPAGDVTLKLDEPLHGRMEAGDELEFSGAVTEYTKDPYMLTMTTDKDQIVGWKPIAPPRRPQQKKKSE